LLADLDTPRNSDCVRSIDLAARMLACSADMALAYHEIASATAGTDCDAARFAAVLRDLETRHRALWDDYQQCWRATNRPLNLDHIGRVWKSVSDGLATLAQEIADGRFP
jgi:hypothetical protein